MSGSTHATIWRSVVRSASAGVACLRHRLQSLPQQPFGPLDRLRDGGPDHGFLEISLMRHVILVAALITAPLHARISSHMLPQLLLNKATYEPRLRFAIERYSNRTGKLSSKINLDFLRKNITIRRFYLFPANNIANTLLKNSNLNVTTANKVSHIRLTPSNMTFFRLKARKKTEDCLDIKDFGAKGDAKTDDTISTQAWIAACVKTGAVCYAGRGTYNISAPINIIDGIQISGLSKNETTFLFTGHNINGLIISSVAPVTIENIRFSYANRPTRGAAIVVDPGIAKQNDNSMFSDLYFNNNYTAINFVRAAYWTLTRSQFYAGHGRQVVIFNLTNPDAGDSVFSENKCIFSSEGGLSKDRECIYWGGSGGLRIVNNKFLNGYRGVEWEIGPWVTGTLTVANNSFENQYADGMFFGQKKSGIGTYTKVTITGNEFLGFGNANGVRLSQNLTSSKWMFGFSFTGNNLELNGDNSGSSPIGLLLAQTQFATVTGNIFRCSGSTTASFGFFADKSVDRLSHSGNLISGCTVDAFNATTNQYTAF